ncbi:hypothetical protein EK904_000643 [Melospiza melodia maxima]|nr:hypothetical protein EK904_000643 [Melospiza melodia maxima]
MQSEIAAYWGQIYPKGMVTLLALCSSMGLWSRIAPTSASSLMVLFLVKQYFHSQAKGSLLEKTTTGWNKYKQECLKMLRESSVDSGQGLGFVSQTSFAMEFRIKSLRKLHCTRNYIHMNLFASFILRAAAVLIKDSVYNNIYSKRPNDESGWILYLSPEIVIICRTAQFFMHYFVGANYFWLLVEGIYLHTLLITVVLSERRLLQTYIVIGWVVPILFVGPWGISRSKLENTGLARSTLVLIPLLGIHEFVFTFITDEQVEGLSRHIRLFIQLTMSSFHGFLVAVLYCFANGEVKAELQKQWSRFLLADPLGCKLCFLGENIKYLRKCSQKRKKQHLGSRHHLCLEVSKPWELQLQKRQSPGAKAGPPQMSMSDSSEGEVTTAETTEEVFEERKDEDLLPGKTSFPLRLISRAVCSRPLKHSRLSTPDLGQPKQGPSPFPRAALAPAGLAWSELDSSEQPQPLICQCWAGLDSDGLLTHHCSVPIRV